jgi:hypothetical protein
MGCSSRTAGPQKINLICLCTTRFGSEPDQHKRSVNLAISSWVTKKSPKSSVLPIFIDFYFYFTTKTLPDSNNTVSGHERTRRKQGGQPSASKGGLGAVTRVVQQLFGWFALSHNTLGCTANRYTIQVVFIQLITEWTHTRHAHTLTRSNTQSHAHACTRMHEPLRPDIKLRS